jgi:hypothetical protein
MVCQSLPCLPGLHRRIKEASAFEETYMTLCFGKHAVTRLA